MQWKTKTKYNKNVYHIGINHLKTNQPNKELRNVDLRFAQVDVPWTV